MNLIRTYIRTCVSSCTQSSVVVTFVLVERLVKWLPCPSVSSPALPPGEATLAVTLKEAFLSFLKDNDHQVRMKVAHLIPVLFEPVRTGCTTTQFQPLPRSAQEALFAGMKQAFSTPPDVLLVSGRVWDLWFIEYITFDANVGSASWPL